MIYMVWRFCERFLAYLRHDGRTWTWRYRHGRKWADISHCVSRSLSREEQCASISQG